MIYINIGSSEMLPMVATGAISEVPFLIDRLKMNHGYRSGLSNCEAVAAC